MLLNQVKVHKAKFVIISTMEEEEIIEVKVKEITKEEVAEISTKKETTISDHSAKEEAIVTSNNYQGYTDF